MRVWIGSTAVFVIAFVALRAVGISIAGEGSLLTQILQGFAVFVGIVAVGILLRRRRLQSRESSPHGVEAERSGVGYANAVTAGLLAGAGCSVWMAVVGNYVGLAALAIVALATILAFWIGRKLAL